MSRLSLSLFVLAISILSTCVNANQVTPVASKYTFKFTQSITGFQIWTAPATRRIRDSDTSVPSATGSSLPISSAMNELESFQVIIAPTSTYSSFTVKVTSFSNLGSTATIDVGAASFSSVSAWGQGNYKVTDLTDPVASGGTVQLSSSLPTVLWITIYVPSTGTTPGNSGATITLTPNGKSAISIPVALYVFNFALTSTAHFATYMSDQPKIEADNLDDRDAWKKVYLQHRMSSSGPDWPNGFNYQVGWDCNKKQLIDADPKTSTESCVWANGCTMRRYALGKGSTWRGVQYNDWIDDGFSIYNPVRTDNGRPDTFCGVSCNDPTGSGWFCSAAYEQQWGLYLKTLQDYFISQNISLSNKIKGFWYTQNEPQNYNDYTISAYLCSVARKYAPKLPIMLSREARPDIAERKEYGNCSYDIWLPHVWRYTPSYTRLHQSLYGEVSWFYSLDTDGVCAAPGQCGPAFQPVISQTGDNGAEDPVATADGPHYRVIPWVGWSNRITGWGYYLDEIFWDTRQAAPAPARPRISASLLREGFEDYEYLYIANGNRQPSPFVKENPDDTAMSVGYAVGSWQSDPTAIHALRHELGLKIEGTRSDYPYLEITPVRPYGNYYIDFKDTSSGSTSPVSFQGKSWMAIGWEKYSVTSGYGWNSKYYGVPNTIDTGNPILRCVEASQGNTIESTICYDDYNSPDEFHFAVAPGVYNVTVAIGWPGKCRDDTEYVEINNVVFRNNTCSPTCCSGVREYSRNVNVYPGANGAGLIMTFGNNLGYTILSYMKIETTSSSLPPSPSSTSSSTSSPVPTSTPSTSSPSSTSASTSAPSTSSPSPSSSPVPTSTSTSVPTSAPTSEPTPSASSSGLNCMCPCSCDQAGNVKKDPTVSKATTMMLRSETSVLWMTASVLTGILISKILLK